MSSRALSTGSSFSDSTKKAILLEVFRFPGKRGRVIAASLNLDRRRVNSFLHHEGIPRYGLRQIAYNWYPPAPRTAIIDPVTKPVPKTANGPKSICRALSELALSEATLKIRTLSLEILDLAFADEDYNLLDDQLKAEFSIRRAELMGRPSLERASSQGPNIWILLIIAATILSISISLSNNRYSNDRRAPSPSLSQ